MSLHHLAIMIPLVAAHSGADISTNNDMLQRTKGFRILQAALFDDLEEVDTPTTTDVAIVTNDTEPESATFSAPIYSPEQCNNWIDVLVSNDLDGSSGLSETEYHSFLSSIEDPPYIAAYFEAYAGFDRLPWVFRVVHKSLACHCEKLGLGEECCEGDNAEVLLSGLKEGNGRSKVEEEYQDLFCQQIAYVLAKSVPSPSPTAGPTANPTKSPSAGPTTSPTSAPSAGPTPAPVTGTPTLSPSDKPTDSRPTTAQPTDAPSISIAPTEANVPEALSVMSSAPDPEEEGGPSTGAVVGIVIALLALIIAALAFVAHRRRASEEDQLRKFAGEQAPERDLEDAPPAAEEAEQAPAPEPAADDVGDAGREPDEDEESEAPSVWSDSSVGEDTVEDELHDDHETPGATAGSALAAMGAASTVAARIGTNNPDLV